MISFFLPGVASAQMGRFFVSVEGWVGASRVVHVGKIVELEALANPAGQVGQKGLEDGTRVVFEVKETIKGVATKRMELILSAHATDRLIYLQKHGTEVVLTVGADRRSSFSQSYPGMESGAKPGTREWSEFHVLETLPVPPGGPEVDVAKRINAANDGGRMFTREFEVVEGSTAILERMRAFAKEYPGMLTSVTVDVPNELGALCGDPGAFCGITLPVCAEVKKTLEAVRDDPELVMGRVEVKAKETGTANLLKSIGKALEKFPEEEEAAE